VSDTPTAPSKRRVTVFYVVLAVATALVAITVFSAGQDREAQESIAAATTRRGTTRASARSST